VIPPVVEAGHRVIAPDLPGFGRSDKPTDLDWYTYDRHTASVTALLDELDLRDATIVVHDWAARSACAQRSSGPSASPGSWCSTPACSPGISG
jgi:pimeloyl-ACP methyl ester carboxylesterase